MIFNYLFATVALIFLSNDMTGNYLRNIFKLFKKLKNLQYLKKIPSLQDHAVSYKSRISYSFPGDGR